MTSGQSKAQTGTCRVRKKLEFAKSEIWAKKAFAVLSLCREELGVKGDE